MSPISVADTVMSELGSWISFVQFQGTPSSARHIPIPVLFAPLLLLQGAGFLFAIYRFVEKLIMLLHSDTGAGIYFRISTPVCNYLGFMHHGSRLALNLLEKSMTLLIFENFKYNDWMFLYKKGILLIAGCWVGGQLMNQVAKSKHAFIMLEHQGKCVYILVINNLTNYLLGLIYLHVWIYL